MEKDNKIHEIICRICLENKLSFDLTYLDQSLADHKNNINDEIVD